MKTQRIIKSVLVSFCAMVCLMMIPGFQAKAVTMTNVTPGVVYSGALTTSSDVKYYRFTVDKTGYTVIYVGRADEAANVYDGWDLNLYDANTGNCLYTKSEIKTSHLTFKINFKKGTQLYYTVSNHAKNDYYYTHGAAYRTKVSTVANNYWEQELNDSINTATPIAKNTMYYGNLWNYKDVDYYKVKVDDISTQVINFSPVDITSTDIRDGWNVHVYDAITNEQLYEYTGLKTNVNLPVMNFKKGTQLLIKVSAHAANTYYWPAYVDYQIRFLQSTKNNWEQEDRVQDTAGWSTFKAGASTLELNKKMYGFLWNCKDDDLYKATFKNAGYATFVFAPNDIPENLEQGYKITIRDNTGNVFYEEAGVKTRFSKKLLMNKGTYYVEVKATNDSYYYAPGNAIYTIQVNYKNGVPKQVSNVKSKKNKITWKKVSNVDHYEINYAQNAKFKNAKTVSTQNTSKKLSLKKGKTYYVRVRAVRFTADNKAVKGKWSKVIKAKR